MKPSAPKPNHKFHVLIVDDDIGRAHLLLSNLTSLNMECRHAANGEQGLAAFREKMPHLVLLDVMMPGIDGYEVCARMRETSTIPIVLMSENLTDEHVMRGLKIGADDYIIKSMHEQVLSAHVIAWLRRVYQYDSVENAPAKGEAAKEKPAKREAAKPIPHPENGTNGVPASEMARTQINPPAGWLRCESCGYMGPRVKFEQTEIVDKRLFCPVCHIQIRAKHSVK